jgi:hypothetical protein
MENREAKKEGGESGGQREDGVYKLGGGDVQRKFPIAPLRIQVVVDCLSSLLFSFQIDDHIWIARAYIRA